MIIVKELSFCMCNVYMKYMPPFVHKKTPACLLARELIFKVSNLSVVVLPNKIL
jgi:hypothetical protein